MMLTKLHWSCENRENEKHFGVLPLTINGNRVSFLPAWTIFCYARWQNVIKWPKMALNCLKRHKMAKNGIKWPKYEWRKSSAKHLSAFWAHSKPPSALLTSVSALIAVCTPSWSLDDLLGCWESWPRGALWLFVPLLDHSTSSWLHRSQKPEGHWCHTGIRHIQAW